MDETHAYPVSQLPKTVAGRIEFVTTLLAGVPIVDEHGNPTGERSGPLISKEMALRLLNLPDFPRD